MTKYDFKNDVLNLFLLLIIVFLSKLSGNEIVKNITAILIILRMLKSKDNVFWFSFILIYASNPMGLFKVYTFGIDIGRFVIDFSPLLIISLYIKLLQKRKLFPLFLNKYIKLLLIVILINFINSFMVGIDSFNVLFRIFKLLINFLYIPIGLKVIRNKIDIQRILYMIFPIITLGIFFQFLVYFFHYEVSYLLFGHELFTKYEGDEVEATENLSRIVYSPYLIGLAVMGAFVLFQDATKRMKNFFVLITIISLLAIMISGTRGWSIAFSLEIFILLFYFKHKTLKTYFKYGLVIFLLGIIISLSPIFKTQFNLATDRLLTLEKLTEGDLTAGGTISRFDDRGPKVMKAFYSKNIYLGSGYSSFFFNHADDHVGHQVLLLQSGIIGYLVLNIYLFLILFMNFRRFLILKNNDGYFLLGAVSLLLAYSAVNIGKTTFTYLMSSEIATSIGFLLVYLSFYYNLSFKKIHEKI